ncbi:MAG: L,D-transpeptidase family protein [Rubrivivax sp.]|nr:L,D-transpeptidase family protein [Rubrivivax sp.]
MLLIACAGARAADDLLPWFDAAGATPRAEAALAWLSQAHAHGLDPADYDIALLQRLWPGAGAEAGAAQRASRVLTTAFVRFLDDLHRGRVSPEPPHARRGEASRTTGFDAAAALRAAFALHDLSLAVQGAVPRVPQYERLREALARYRALAGHEAWQQPLPPLPAAAGSRPRALEPGAAWAGAARLRARLSALGDLALPAEVPAGDDRYDPALVAAVQSFQDRHGLDADGVIGRATLSALQVSPAARARQLELALERLRWTPWHAGPRMIVVNIPEFRLRAYEVTAGEAIAMRADMKVIVGEALDTRTPLLLEQLRHIEFKPYWNVPASIARKELVPQLRRNPALWASEGFEFVAGGAVDPVLTEAKLQAVLEGRLRIRQRPGPRNALGDIKFVFPNREGIFLHHTPAVQLFEHARRDFSHGCIRVEQPVALAAFALQGLPGWDEARVRAAMAAAGPSIQALAQPVPVLVAYGTALVKQGRVHFFDDVYGHDRALQRALANRPRR